MKRLTTFRLAGLVAIAVPAVALAQTTPQNQQTTPPNRSQQTMPQQMQQRGNSMQMHKNMPMRHSGSAKQEVATAHAHALMAQGAKSLKMTHTHLHHVINCLEGSSGTDFDAQAGNPCKGKGQGAIPDSTSNQAMQGKLKQALAQAKSGLQANNLQKAHADAAKVAGMLQAPTAPGGM